MSTVNLLLIPCRRQGVITLPKNMVEYVLPYALPLPSGYDDPALVGAIIYKNQKVPVLDMAYLLDPDDVLPLDQGAGGYRIVIVSCITDEANTDSYAVISRGAPRLLEVDADAVEEIDEQVPLMMHSKITVGDSYSRQEVYIPNVEKIESEILV